MFDTLLETRGRRDTRSAGGTIASVVIHSALIVGATAATAVGRTPPPLVRDAGVVFVATPTPARPPSSPLPPTSPPTDPQRWPVVIPPLDSIPTGIPDPPTGLPIDPATIFAPGTAHPGAPGTGDPVGSPSDGEPWTAALVEKPALALPGSPVPAYPDILRRSGVSGEVVAQFVVDTIGRVEPGSFRALWETQALFAAAVERVLPQLRFVAAEVGGRHVRQLVQQSFVFAIER